MMDRPPSALRRITLSFYGCLTSLLTVMGCADEVKCGPGLALIYAEINKNQSVDLVIGGRGQYIGGSVTLFDAKIEASDITVTNSTCLQESLVDLIIKRPDRFDVAITKSGDLKIRLRSW